MVTWGTPILGNPRTASNSWMSQSRLPPTLDAFTNTDGFIVGKQMFTVFTVFTVLLQQMWIFVVWILCGSQSFLWFVPHGIEPYKLIWQHLKSPIRFWPGWTREASWRYEGFRILPENPENKPKFCIVQMIFDVHPYLPWLPSGKHTKSYGKLPFIVDFPIENGDFP